MDLGEALFLEAGTGTSPACGDIDFEVGTQGESTHFKAHILVLSLRSPVWAAEFRQGGFKESREHRVQIPDVDPRHFAVFLQLLYTTKLVTPNEFTVADLMEVTVLIDRYSVSGFAEQVCRALKPKLVFGATLALALRELQRIPRDSEYRVGILESCHSAISYRLDFKENLGKELTLFGEDTGAAALEAKLLLLHTVHEKLIREWSPKSFHTCSCQAVKDAFEAVQKHMWETLSLHGVSDAGQATVPALKRPRTSG